MSARALPPQPALFDLVVIAEAAQCNIPAILPMLTEPGAGTRGSSHR